MANIIRVAHGHCLQDWGTQRGVLEWHERMANGSYVEDTLSKIFNFLFEPEPLQLLNFNRPGLVALPEMQAKEETQLLEILCDVARHVYMEEYLTMANFRYRLPHRFAAFRGSGKAAALAYVKDLTRCLYNVEKLALDNLFFELMWRSCCGQRIISYGAR